MKADVESGDDRTRGATEKSSMPADFSNFTQARVVEMIRSEYSDADGELVLAELNSLRELAMFDESPTMLAQLQLSILKLAGGQKEFILDKTYKEMFADLRDLIVAAGYG